MSSSSSAPERPAPSWSKRDEENLNLLLMRKKEFNSHYMPPVQKIAEAISELPVARRFDWLIDQADNIRDALEPFDSGVRGVKK